MDENTVLQDILDRLTDMTKYVMDINAEMLRRPEYTADKERIYAKIATVQAEMLAAMKDAIQIVDAKIVLHDGKIAAAESAANRFRVPGWVIAILSGIASLVGQQGFELAEKSFAPLKH